MKSIVPYSKEIKFDSKISEICSISLEHELNINDTELEGNFIVSGEYKSHAISINKEKFNYKLPFSIDVTDNIIKESIDFEITDFNYEVLNDNTLKVDIEFSVTAMESDDEEDLSELLDRDLILEELNEVLYEKEIEEKEDEEVLKNQNEELVEDERLDKESAELILNSASNKENEYTTYYIHLVKEGDTIDSIVSAYQTDLAILKKYNTIETLNIGDKILIPTIDE